MAETNPKLNGVDDLETLVARAKRAFALRQLEESVALYAQALEKYAPDCNPNSVDIYYLYGTALLENAIASSAVLGNKQEDQDQQQGGDSPGGPATNDSRFNFGADGEDEPVDLLGQAANAGGPEEDAEGDEEEGGGDVPDEPEDDFNAAWEILDLARKTYDSIPGDINRLKLAATYVALGDISLETEKFEQAISDYNEALDLKIRHLPPTSREITEAHFKLSMAYDMTSGKLSSQIEHVEKALSSLKARLAALEELLPNAPETVQPLASDGGKGKGKATNVVEDPIGWLPRDDSIDRFTKSQVEAEIADVKSLCGELEAKLDDIKSTPEEGVNGPNEPGGTTMDKVGRELDKELKAMGAFGSTALDPNQPVNDLTSVVRKKKPKTAPVAPVGEAVPVTETTSLGKRKAEDEPEGAEKRARLE